MCKDTKLTPDKLCDPKRGVVAVYKTFKTLKFKGKHNEAPRGTPPPSAAVATSTGQRPTRPAPSLPP